MSSSEIPIVIELIGIGSLEAQIIRYLCPLTAEAVIEKIPFNLRGRFSFGSKKYWTLPGIEIFKGSNQMKAKKKVKKGDIVYNPKTDELMIIIEDLELPNRVNKIGEVINNLELLLKAKNGLGMKWIRKK